MSFEITVRGNTLSQLAKNVLLLAAQYQTTPAETDDSVQYEYEFETETPEPEPEPETKAETKAAKVGGNKKAPAAKDTAPAGKTAPATLDYAKDVAPKVLKLAELKGRDAAKEVLAQFGVERAPHLSADKYPAFVEALDAAMAE